MLKILSFLCSGLATGLLLSVPIGPANILCLEKTLKSGTFAGFMTGAGATFGDFLFVIAAIMGFIAIGDTEFENAYFIKILGIVVLLIFGCLSILKGYFEFNNKGAHQTLFFLHNQNTNHANKRVSFLSGFFTSFILTITNPLTPVGVISSVVAMGLSGGIFSHDLRFPVIFFASGIIIGSLGWWFCLTMIAKKFSKKLTGRDLSLVNYCAGILMLGMAVYIFYT